MTRDKVDQHGTFDEQIKPIDYFETIKLYRLQMVFEPPEKYVCDSCNGEGCKSCNHTGFDVAEDEGWWGHPTNPNGDQGKKCSTLEEAIESTLSINLLSPVFKS